MDGARQVKLLLDTHIWLWSLLEPARLTKRVARALASSANELWISPVSTWEILVLSAKGRVQLEPDVESWIEAAFARASLREAPLTHEVAMATAKVDLAHRDPADRFLAATARTYGLTLVTAGGNLLAGSGYEVMPNR